MSVLEFEKRAPKQLAIIPDPYELWNDSRFSCRRISHVLRAPLSSERTFRAVGDVPGHRGSTSAPATVQARAPFVSTVVTALTLLKKEISFLFNNENAAELTYFWLDSLDRRKSVVVAGLRFVGIVLCWALAWIARLTLWVLAAAARLCFGFQTNWESRKNDSVKAASSTNPGSVATNCTDEGPPIAPLPSGELPRRRFSGSAASGVSLDKAYLVDASADNAAPNSSAWNARWSATVVQTRRASAAAAVGMERHDESANVCSSPTLVPRRRASILERLSLDATRTLGSPQALPDFSAAITRQRQQLANSLRKASWVSRTVVAWHPAISGLVAIGSSQDLTVAIVRVPNFDGDPKFLSLDIFPNRTLLLSLSIPKAAFHRNLDREYTLCSSFHPCSLLPCLAVGNSRGVGVWFMQLHDSLGCCSTSDRRVSVMKGVFPISDEYYIWKFSLLYEVPLTSQSTTMCPLPCSLAWSPDGEVLYVGLSNGSLLEISTPKHRGPMTWEIVATIVPGLDKRRKWFRPVATQNSQPAIVHLTHSPFAPQLLATTWSGRIAVIQSNGYRQDSQVWQLDAIRSSEQVFQPLAKLTCIGQDHKGAAYHAFLFGNERNLYIADCSPMPNLEELLAAFYSPLTTVSPPTRPTFTQLPIDILNDLIVFLPETTGTSNWNNPGQVSKQTELPRIVDFDFDLVSKNRIAVLITGLKERKIVDHWQQRTQVGYHTVADNDDPFPSTQAIVLVYRIQKTARAATPGRHWACLFDGVWLLPCPVDLEKENIDDRGRSRETDLVPYCLSFAPVSIARRPCPTNPPSTGEVEKPRAPESSIPKWDGLSRSPISRNIAELDLGFTAGQLKPGGQPQGLTNVWSRAQNLRYNEETTTDREAVLQVSWITSSVDVRSEACEERLHTAERRVAFYRINFGSLSPPPIEQPCFITATVPRQVFNNAS